MIRKKFSLLSALAAVVVLLTLCSCGDKPRGNTVYFDDNQLSVFGDIPEDAGFDFRPAASVLDHLRDGAVILWENAAAQLARAGVEAETAALCSAAVVIGLDASSHDEKLSGWSDLPEYGGTIYIDSEILLKLSAASYSLFGDFDPEKAAFLFAPAGREGRITRIPDEAELFIIYDYQAQALKRRGRDIEIIIPAEGTLAFDLCLAADNLSGYEIGKMRGLLGELGFSPAGYTPEGAVRLDESQYERMYSGMRYADNIFKDTVGGSDSPLYCRSILQTLLIIALFLTAIVFCGFAYYTAVERRIRFALICEGAMIFGWCVTRIVNWMYYIHDTRLYWYMYYFYIGGLMIVLVVMTAAAAGWNRRAFYFSSAAAAINFAAFLLVITNDLHGLVFSLDPSVFRMTGNYTYRAGYFAVFGIFALEAVYSVLKLISASLRAPTRRGAFIPAVFLAAALAYSVLYIYGSQLLTNDLSFIWGTFWLVMTGAVIFAGLVPVNIGYKSFFAATPLSMEITDSYGRTEMISDGALPAGKEIISRLYANGVTVSEDKMWRMFPINGGNVIWKSDISEIAAVRRETAEANERLRAANALLARQEASSRGRMSAEKLYEIEYELENELSGRMSQITALASELREGGDVVPELAMQLCFVKRLSNIFFMSRDPGSVMSVGDLSVYLSELCDISGWKKTKSFVSCSGEGELTCGRAALIYELCFIALDGAEDGGSVLITLRSDDGLLTVNVTGSAPPPALSGALSLKADRLGVRITPRETEDIHGETITSPLGVREKRV